MGLSWKGWNRSDVIYGVIVPLVVVLVIVGFSSVTWFFSYQSMGFVIGIISTIEEMLVLVAIPLMLGLVWNRWAGGASGFLMGSIYSIWWAVQYGVFSFFGGQRGGTGFGPTLLGWVLSAMLIGYMSGALNKGSENFRRMIIAGVVSTTVSGVFLFGMFHLSSLNVITGLDGFLITVLTRTATGIVIPIIAKVFMWYGITRGREPTSY